MRLLPDGYEIDQEAWYGAIAAANAALFAKVAGPQRFVMRQWLQHGVDLASFMKMVRAFRKDRVRAFMLQLPPPIPLRKKGSDR